jgi:hypothetical protein
MRSNEEILKEVQEDCIKNNCQSCNTIALVAMDQAIKECKEEIIEQLNQMSNNYDVVDVFYVVYKDTLDNYIFELEITT